MTPFFDFFKKKGSIDKHVKRTTELNKIKNPVPSTSQISLSDTMDLLEKTRERRIKDLKERIKPLHGISLQHMNNIKNIAIELERAKIEVEEKSFENMLQNSKRTVLSSVKKEISSFPGFPNTLDDINGYHERLDSMVHRFSELSSSHKKVFNFFIKKYAERLENEFKNISQISKEYKREVHFFEDELKFLDSSIDSLRNIEQKKETIQYLESLVDDKRNDIDHLKERLKKARSDLHSLLNSQKYHEAQQIKKQIVRLESERKDFHKELINHFSKVSRVFNKYSYGMNKKVIHQFEIMNEKPWEIFLNDTNSYTTLIQEVKSSMMKGKINVKDSDKVISYLENILQSFGEFEKKEKYLNKQISDLNGKPDLQIFLKRNDLQEQESYLSQELSSKESSYHESQLELKQNKTEIDDLKRSITKCLLESTGKNYSLQ